MKRSSVNREALALLKKYRAGACTPEEMERVERWFNSFGEGDEHLSLADRAAIEDATKRILDQTDPGRNTQVRKLKPAYWWYSAAACLLIGLSVFAFLFQRSASVAAVERNRVFVTANGQRKQVILPDGSVITLNAASSFKLLNFSAGNRTVALNGEAFFKIAKDKAHPFIIKTGKIQTHVVGTSFNIRAYADEPDISVAVSSGKVQVEENKAAGKILGAGMTVNHLFTYNTQSGLYTQSISDAANFNCWLNNQISFNKATLTEMAKTLQRAYNVQVLVVGSPAKNPHFTVKFNIGKLDLTLAQLSVLTGVTYRQTAQGVVLDVSNIK